MKQPLLNLNNISVTFKTRRQDFKAVEDLSLTLKEGEILGLVGESGAGKSITGAAILGLIPSSGNLSSGEISFKGQRIDKDPKIVRGSKISMIFQDPLVSLNPLRRIGDQLIETIQTHSPCSRTEAYDRAIKSLEEVGIDQNRFNAYPHTFSGGMRQRVVIALALAPQPAIIVADEPTTSLDVSNQAQILSLLKKLCKEKRTSVILITHDMGVISQTTDRVAVLYSGKLVEIGITQAVLKNPRHAYTQSLVRSTPRIERGSPKQPIHQIPDSKSKLCPDSKVLIAEDLTREFDLSPTWFYHKFNVHKQRRVLAVDSVSFSINKGETYGLVGDSGSGKSTIAKMAVGLLRPSSGQITVNGENLNSSTISHRQSQRIRRRIQMVFQSPYASLNPRWKIGSILAEPIRVFGLSSTKEEEQNRVFELLDQVGLSKSDVEKYPHEFSGGQRQRISIARALASKPEIIICDEPTSALDVSVQAQVLTLLKELQREFSLTYLFITHDLAVVSTMANKIGVLNQGRLIEEQSSELLFSKPQHEHTKMLLDSAPKLDIA
ncbi:MAG: ABC transporter ATP-binding protein [Paracoccaceae bacterium]|nr:ABC transporter ATP-binding protein [Paracoccaceae bacterium]